MAHSGRRVRQPFGYAISWSEREKGFNMFSYQQQNNCDYDSLIVDGKKVHSRKKGVGVGRMRFALSKKRSTRTRSSGQAIVGIGHRRNRKWTW